MVQLKTNQKKAFSLLSQLSRFADSMQEKLRIRHRESKNSLWALGAEILFSAEASGGRQRGKKMV